MKPTRTAEADLRLWGVVTATVRPLAGRPRPAGSPHSASARPAPAVADKPKAPDAPIRPSRPPATSSPAPPTRIEPAARSPSIPAPLEPQRRRRLERGRDTPAGVIDLHGLTQDEARDALTRFILRGFSERRRTLLVITGKGALGDGVLRRRVPEWLGQSPLRPMIAGLSEAHRRHGGEGALYVALRRC